MVHSRTHGVALQLWYIVINMTSTIGISPNDNHVAVVHFSSPPAGPGEKTNILTNLSQTNTIQELTDKINGLSKAQVLGISDLDL